MPLTTFDDLFTQSLSETRIYKVSATVVAGAWYTTFGHAGSPAALALNAGNSTNGEVVSSDNNAVDGFSYPFGSRTEPTAAVRVATLESSVPMRGRMVDVQYRFANISAAAGTTTPTTPPTIPLDYADNELWVWTSTAPTGTLSLNVSYLNQAGASKSTGAVSLTLSGANGRMARIPLASGDRAVTQVTSIVRSGATAGAVTLLVLAPVWKGRVPVANGFVRDGMDQTGLAPIRKDAALMLMVAADSTASGDTEISLLAGSSA